MTNIEQPQPSVPRRDVAMSGEAFPVDSLAAAVPELRRPFTPAAVRFKVQSPKLAVAFIDSRLVSDRLNLVCPEAWYDQYGEPIGGHLVCWLTVFGITRQDVGTVSSQEPIKGLYSDALKRASVKFGVGTSLYSLPKFWLTSEDCRMKEGKPAGLTDTGERRLRAIYAQWLKDTGVARFGATLDHGDAEDAVGDHETERAPQSPPREPLVSDEHRQRLHALSAERQVDAVGLAAMMLVVTGSPSRSFATMEEAEDWVDRAMPRLSARHAIALEADLVSPSSAAPVAFAPERTDDQPADALNALERETLGSMIADYVEAGGEAADVAMKLSELGEPHREGEDLEDAAWRLTHGGATEFMQWMVKKHELLGS